jgi:hypothetical protein
MVCKSCANFGDSKPRLLPLALAVFTRTRHSDAPAGNVARAARAAGKFQRNLFKADSKQGRITFLPVSMRQFFIEKSVWKASSVVTLARADFVDARPGTS